MAIFLNRIEREILTVRKMVILYCNDKHSTKEKLCDKCQYISDYANKKLDKCVFSEEKPACSECTVHCYRKDERELIKEIMRYSGPRMILKHPFLAIMHLIDQKRSKKKRD